MEKPGLITVKVLHGKILKNKGFFRKFNPYVLMKLGTQSKRTSVHKKGNKNPAWEEPLTFRRSTEQSLTLECWDHRKAASDSLLGAVDVQLSSLENSSEEFFSIYKKSKNVGKILLHVQWKEDSSKPTPKPIKEEPRKHQKRIPNPLPPGTGAIGYFTVTVPQ
mmetsp:Transcript_13521/g.19750  ORF Transcript_13521/g.19750 Transcript_13521/m.19750 type:complete len:163 (+) Transcript_13521:1902-2390(+)